MLISLNWIRDFVDLPTDLSPAARSRSASSVAASGAFARAGEDEIVITFEYLFVQNSNAELVVYLSAEHDVGADRLEVARLHLDRRLPRPALRRRAVRVTLDDDDLLGIVTLQSRRDLVDQREGPLVQHGAAGQE
mgnify:CR=1 FL=1